MSGRSDLNQRGSAWLRWGERGSILGITLLAWSARIVGRRGASVLLRVIALYYTLFARHAARASRDYLTRLHGRVTFAMVYRHVLHFAQCVLDRIFVAQGRLDLFETSHRGHEHLVALARSGTGAVLLGAHLGSFEIMRSLARTSDLKLSVLAHFENARRINAFLRSVNPAIMQEVIAIDPANPSFILEVQERIGAGELVAVLGDRTGLGERSVEVEFLGSPARFPAGPFMIAAALGCPIYLTFGLYYPPNRYALHCEPFAERLELPRKTRDQAIHAEVQRWARRLEYYCRAAPYNWFNFYDFWEA